MDLTNAGEGRKGDGDRDHSDEDAIIHPLLMDHVAKNIFGYLGWSYSNPNLLACRSVCKTWMHLITDAMISKRKVRKLTFNGNTSTLINEFVRDMSQTLNLPFASFEFEIHFFRKQNSQVFCDFCRLFDRYIMDLSLTVGKHYTLDLIEESECDSFDFCNLQKLCFHCTEIETMPDCSLKSTSCSWLPTESSTRSKGLLKLLKAILSNADSLVHLEFSLPVTYLDGDKGTNKKIGELLATSLSDTVKDLKLSMELTDDQLVMLSKTRLKLESLDLEFSGGKINDEMEPLRNFLRSQSKCLKNLRLVDYDSIYCDQYCEPVEFSNVKTLFVKMTGSSFSFLNSFPKLQTLILLCGDIPTSPDSFDREMCGTISTLELRLPIVQPYFATKLVTYLPNVTTLRLQVTCTPDSVKATENIFAGMTKLKELKLTFPDPFKKQAIDSLLTGLPLGFCNEVMSEAYINRKIHIPATRRPSLTNLSHLKKFTIESAFNSTFLTGATVRLALFCMPRMEEFAVIGEHRITFGWLQALRQRMQFTEVWPDNDGGPPSMALVPVTSANGGTLPRIFSVVLL